MPKLDTHSTFPNALEACFVVIGLFMLEYLVGAGLFDLRRVLDATPEELGAMGTVIGNGLAFTLIMQFKQMNYASLFHASRSSAKATFFVLLAPLLMITPLLVFTTSGLVNAVTEYLPISQQQEAIFARMGSHYLPMVVCVCILAPLFEEMLFRGVILRSFLQQYPRWAAIWGSAALFGLAHMNLYQFIGATIFGGIAGWLYERTRSLIPGIVLHALNNTFVTFFIEDSLGTGSTGSLVLRLIAYIASGGIGGWLLYSMLRRSHPCGNEE